MKVKLYIQKQLKSFRYAFKGWKLMLHDHNVWIHLPAAIGMVGIGLWLGFARDEWLWIISAIAAVWIAETFNTAIENLVDLVQPDYHEKAGKVKDLSAGAVLFATVYAVIVGLIITLPYFLDIIWG